MATVTAVRGSTDAKTYVRDVEVSRGVADVQHGHAHRLAPEPVPVVELQHGGGKQQPVRPRGQSLHWLTGSHWGNGGGCLESDLCSNHFEGIYQTLLSKETNNEYICPQKVKQYIVVSAVRVFIEPSAKLPLSFKPLCRPSPLSITTHSFHFCTPL